MQTGDDSGGRSCNPLESSRIQLKTLNQQLGMLVFTSRLSPTRGIKDRSDITGGSEAAVLICMNWEILEQISTYLAINAVH